MEPQEVVDKDANVPVGCDALLLSLKRKLGETSRVAASIGPRKKWRNNDSNVKEWLKMSLHTSSSSLRTPPIYERGIVVNSRFVIEKLLGSGSFGEIYRALDLCTQKDCALKVEKRSQSISGTLKIESDVYESIKNGIRVPKISFFGKDKVSKNQILVMDLLGSSLQEMLTKCGGRFSPLTVAMLADQMIERIEYLHSKSFLHRDIKPQNLLLGLKNLKKEGNPRYWKELSGEKLYSVDYSLAKKYRDEKLKHIKAGSYRSVTGTVRYASIYSHLGQELSRRDDLESIGYVLLYFLKGRLSWQGQDGKNRQEKHDKIQDLKMKIPIHDLCKGYPDLAKYIDYCRRLVYEEVPDYAFLRSIFRTQINQHEANGFELVYDWNREQA